MSACCFSVSIPLEGDKSHNLLLRMHQIIQNAVNAPALILNMTATWANYVFLHLWYRNITCPNTFKLPLLISAKNICIHSAVPCSKRKALMSKVCVCSKGYYFYWLLKKPLSKKDAPSPPSFADRMTDWSSIWRRWGQRMQPQGHTLPGLIDKCIMTLSQGRYMRFSREYPPVNYTGFYNVLMLLCTGTTGKDM